MEQARSFARIGVIVAVCRALLAYLDPGSGSLIVQVLIAIIVGALATFRFWKARLLSLFGIKQDTDDEDESASSD